MNIIRLWLNGNTIFYVTQYFMKHLLKINNKEISVYLREKQMFHIQHHSTSFNIMIIQQPRTMIQTKTFCFIEAETNICLMQHCVVVQPKPNIRIKRRVCLSMKMFLPIVEVGIKSSNLKLLNH